MEELILQPYGKGYLVSGNTLPYKDDLKLLGGGWNRTLGGWVFKQSDFNAINEFVRDVNNPNVTRITEVVKSPSQTITRQITRSPVQRAPLAVSPKITRVVTRSPTITKQILPKMQTLTYYVPLPVLNQTVTVRMHNKDKIYTVYEIVANDDIRLLHDDVIDRAVVVNGKWQIDNMVAHEIIF